MNWREWLGNGDPITWYDLWLIDFKSLRENRQYFKGNLAAGFGVMSCVSLVSPLANFVFHWKARAYELRFIRQELDELLVKDKPQ